MLRDDRRALIAALIQLTVYNCSKYNTFPALLFVGRRRQFLHSMQWPPVQLYRGSSVPAGLCGASRGHQV